MDKNPNKPFRGVPVKSFLSSSSSEDETSDVEQENGSRRSGMRFTTIEDFLASLNTATTAVSALQGLQTLSVESYQKSMPGAQAEESSGDTAQQLMAANKENQDKEMKEEDAKEKAKKTFQ
ncbi:uncharacterized protein [Drosophila virilis]|uniref:Uncharacterized protein n=1 Tax=Drosophila virilis TaxID=7244 RepID=B4M3H3_DROVI|nr:uncharacterized protein LOC6631691 [Drosophila virilis]EDW65348.2 uncharacterized protein Dvir_GJ18957 [Drosophila virilis]